ncbi:MAG: EamA family transporter [Pseudomonadota bacterium]
MAQKTEKQPSVQATLFGGAAIAMWGLLALLTDLSGEIPPFQLAAMSFAIGAIVCFALDRRAITEVKSLSVRVVAAGALGLAGYHALYFTALKNAPAIEASLIAYLWPLMIVVGSALLPGETLRSHHVIGAAIGFAGCGLIIGGGSGFSAQSEHAFGYGVALAAAFTWTAYSLLSRKFSRVPTFAVAWYCLLSAIGCSVIHIAAEPTKIPGGAIEWVAVMLLGLLPVGAAFFAWDVGMKRGHIAVIGAASYGAPLLSSIFLIAAGRTDLTMQIALACLLITFGALLAAKDLIRKT